MNKYDIIIVGSGISGLYIAYNILKINKNVKLLILEKNNYLGGRILTFSKTINKHKYIFDEGAYRFNNNHKLLFKLINELNLMNDLIEINAGITFCPTYKFEQNMEYHENSPYYLINKVILYSKKDKKETLQKYTFIEYVEKILNKEEIKFLMDSFGFYGIIIKTNAYNAIKLCEEGLNPSLQFYSLKNGLGTIIKELQIRILQMGGKILLNTDVINITQDLKIITNEKIYNTKTCICAIQKPDLLKLNIFNTIRPLLNSIGNVPLCKIYSIFKNKYLWYKNINKTTTNNSIRMVIPLDTNDGSLIISFSDGKFANGWNKLYNNINEHKFIEVVKKKYI